MDDLRIASKPMQTNENYSMEECPQAARSGERLEQKTASTGRRANHDETTRSGISCLLLGVLAGLSSRLQPVRNQSVCRSFGVLPAFRLPLQAGSSKHLRKAGTTSACSSVGSFKFESVSLMRFAPAR